MERFEMHVAEALLGNLRLKEDDIRKFSKQEISITTKVVDRFGIPSPIIVDNKNEIVLGANLYLAAKNLNAKTVPTVQLKDLSEKEIKMYSVAMNKILTMGEIDLESIKIDIKDWIFDENFTITPEELGLGTIEVDSILFELSGFSASDAEEQNETKAEEAVLSDIPKIVKPGDLIQLGQHRLFCGDSMKAESYTKLLGEEKADIIITDPPYNVKIQGHVTKKKNHPEFAQASGEMKPEDFINFLNTVTKNLKNFSKSGSIHYLFMDWKHLFELQIATKDVYEKLLNICVWDKGKGGMGSFYRSQHEFCLVYQNGTGSHKNNIQLGKNGRNRSNIWQYPGINSGTSQAKTLSNLHPTVKPVSMLVDILLDASDFGDIVLDTFGGSGSTLIAAQECGRKARLIEISPDYCDVIIHRWEKMTGKKHKIIERVAQ